jgi:hypothetical protein
MKTILFWPPYTDRHKKMVIYEESCSLNTFAVIRTQKH